MSPFTMPADVSDVDFIALMERIKKADSHGLGLLNSLNYNRDVEAEAPAYIEGCAALRSDIMKAIGVLRSKAYDLNVKTKGTIPYKMRMLLNGDDVSEKEKEYERLIVQMQKEMFDHLNQHIKENKTALTSCLKSGDVEAVRNYNPVLDNLLYQKWWANINLDTEYGNKVSDIKIEATWNMYSTFNRKYCDELNQHKSKILQNEQAN